jgi:tetratricopeptide (TPR) repeat protein
LATAQEICESLQDSISLAEVLNEVGCVYREQSRYREAENSLSRSVELAQDKGDAFCVVDSMEDISEVYYRRGDLERAKQKAEAARALASEHGYSQLESNCLRNLGHITLAQGLVQEAFTLYAQACLVAASHSFPVYRRQLDVMENQCLSLSESQLDRVSRQLIEFWRKKGATDPYPEFIEKCECVLGRNW